MISLMLATRSVMRNVRRSATVAGAAAISGLVLTCAAAFLSGTMTDMKASIINGGAGHFQIARVGAFDGYSENQLDLAMTPGEVAKVERWANHNNGVVATARRLTFGGLISNGPRTISFTGVGLDPKIEQHAFKPNIALISGTWLPATSNRDVAVIGQGIAHQLRLKTGDIATLLSTTGSGAINAVDVTVVGIVETGSPQSDSSYLQVALPTAQALLATNGISKIAVLAKSDIVADELKPLAAKIDPHLEVRTWRTLTPIFDQIVALYGGMFGFFGVTLALVSTFTIAGAVLTSVLERTEEIGIMRALAIKRPTIRAMFVWEGAILGAAGTALGIVVGLAVTMGLNRAHLMMPPPPGATVGYPLHLQWNMPMELMLLAFFVLLAVLAAWLVSGRASKLTILEALAAE